MDFLEKYSIMNKNNKKKNMFKKFGFITLATFLCLTGNVFAGADTVINVNDLEVTLTRSIGAEFETYEVTANDSIQSLDFEFTGTSNNLSVTKSGESWTIEANYNGKNISSDASSLTEIDINEDKITDLGSEIISSSHIIFTVSTAISDAFFNRVLVNHDPFSFNAVSQNGKDITVTRTNESGDAYTFSSSETFTRASIVDGDNSINIQRNGNDFNVSGNYNGRYANETLTVGMPFEITVNYGGMEVALQGDEHNLKITPDPSIIEAIANKILEEKKKITEITVEDGVAYEIPQGSSLRNIEIPANVSEPQVKFTVENNKVSVSQDLTITSQNINGMQVVIPQSTEITGPNGWNGQMMLPTDLSLNPSVSPEEIEGYTNFVESAIKIGLENQNLSFTKPVKITFPNKAGKKVGFVKNSIFAEIENTCDSLNPTLGENSECKINSGSDLFVFTNHFTEFVVYTQIANSSGSGGGSDINYLTISNINISATENSATITFNTNDLASTTVKYGISQENHTETLEDKELKTSHSFNLTGLLAGTVYYKLEANDGKGSTAERMGNFTISQSNEAVNVPTSSDTATIETSTKIKEQKTYNYNGVITTKPLTEMNKNELFRLLLMLILKSLLAQRGITL
ncbi:MAG: hypothetical protein PHY30_01775 [Candidatus Pacebacteria bacterium]|nr:hypothetical protein [Candidatus Paceibacterota bacterium]